MSDPRESDRLLDFAEAQYDRVTRLEQRRAIVLALVCLSGSLSGSSVYGARSGLWVQALTSAAVLTTVFAAILVSYVYPSTSSLLHRERAALGEVLSLLQESEKHLADKEHWTLLERATFRLRLRRLPVGLAGPSKASTTSPLPSSASTPPTTV